MSIESEVKERVKIAISIATFNRPEGLQQVLDGIAMLQVPTDAELRVVVVDNSENANAEKQVANLINEYEFPLNYFHEKQKGISYSRNRGLLDALERGDDYLVFIDDDEFPEPDWIIELLATINRSGAAAVSGGVKPKFSKKPAWWVEKAGIFEILNYPENEAIPYAHTTNAMVDLEVVRSVGVRFDPQFALTGGEDTLFFSEIREAGHDTVFSKNALVYEDIVPQRATLSWLLKRWYRTGNTDGLVQRKSDKSFLRKVTIWFGGGVRVLVGALGVVVTSPLLLLKKTQTFNFIKICCRGVGFMSSAMGVAYEEYRNHNR